jgi:hypothetical protein
LVQTAETVAYNTTRLREALQDVADFYYADGPENPGTSARPWWYRETDRFPLSVKYWSQLLSEKQFDGIVGLSQGSAMTAILITMVCLFSFLAGGVVLTTWDIASASGKVPWV